MASNVYCRFLFASIIGIKSSNLIFQTYTNVNNKKINSINISSSTNRPICKNLCKIEFSIGRLCRSIQLVQNLFYRKQWNGIWDGNHQQAFPYLVSHSGSGGFGILHPQLD